MANEKKRILQLFYILAQQDQYIRSYELAEKVGVTERTVKNDIPELEAFAKAADGKATKIIIPSEIQGIAGLAKSVTEIAADHK